MNVLDEHSALHNGVTAQDIEEVARLHLKKMVNDFFKAAARSGDPVSGHSLGQLCGNIFYWGYESGFRRAHIDLTMKEDIE